MDSTDEAPSFKLRIDAHALVQLGEQLITDDEQALLELVKNSYDADAAWAHVTIDTTYKPTADDNVSSDAIGLIEIEDNGTGMDRHGIERGWLLISVSLKRTQKIVGQRTEKYLRLPLGDKGLGRLGTMKLGKFLSVETRHSEKSPGWLVTFQWSDAKSGTPLDEVPISWRRVPANGCTGTTVRVLGLNDVIGWQDEGRRRRLETKLSGLLSPFQSISNFDVEVKLDDRKIDLARIGPRLRETAAATFSYDWDGARLLITGKLKLVWFKKKTPGYEEYIARDNGKTFFEHLQTKRKFVHEFKPTISTDPSWFLEITQTLDLKDISFVAANGSDPGPFSGSLDHFDLDEDIVIPRTLFEKSSDYRELIKALAQIYVYRDGFGIRMPNDWLRLGAAWTSQTGFYSLKPSNTIGFFQLSVEKNSGLVEKSDREGFTENDALRGFSVLSKTISTSANKCLNRLGKAAASFLNEKTGVHATEHQSSANYGELVQRLDRLLSVSDRVRHELREHSEARRRTLGKLEGTTRLFVLDLLQPKEKRDKARLLLESVERLEADLASDHAKVEELTTELTNQKELAAIIRRRIDDFEERSRMLYEMVGVGLSAQALAHDAPPMLDHLEHQAKAFQKFGTA